MLERKGSQSLHQLVRRKFDLIDWPKLREQASFAPIALPVGQAA